MRDRLIDLVIQADEDALRKREQEKAESNRDIYGFIADYLMDNGVIVLPCAVGDTVYVKMLGGGLAKAKVRDYVHFLTDGFCLTLTSDEFPKQHIPISEIGKTVFLTPEEAEAKLAEMEGVE